MGYDYTTPADGPPLEDTEPESPEPDLHKIGPTPRVWLGIPDEDA